VDFGSNIKRTNYYINRLKKAAEGDAQSKLSFTVVKRYFLLNQQLIQIGVPMQTSYPSLGWKEKKLPLLLMISPAISNTDWKEKFLVSSVKYNSFISRGNHEEICSRLPQW
jgi:hypothetical protein